MVMNPRTHPRGAPPDFTLPKTNPKPERMTDAMWWLVCMREALEPSDSENGGTYVDKPAYHNAGENLPDHGLGDPRTDASIRRAPDREGPWWKTKTAAHDWTFFSAQHGDYANINKYVKRLIDAMRSPTDLRPDDVYAYTIGQLDGDVAVEGWNEYRDDWETGDKTHLWHRHDSFRRNIVGNFWAMWKALTIDMGWTYAEWLASTTSREWDEMATKQEVRAEAKAALIEVLADGYAAATGKASGDTAVDRQKRNVRDFLRAIVGGPTGDVDEQQIAAAVLAGLDPKLIAAAIPADLAQRVADELHARLAS